MTVYIIIKQGVYGHGCMGVATTPAQAETMARQCAADDHDDYHDYNVYPMKEGVFMRPEGEYVWQEDKATQGAYVEVEPIFSCDKSHVHLEMTNGQHDSDPWAIEATRYSGKCAATPGQIPRGPWPKEVGTYCGLHVVDPYSFQHTHADVTCAHCLEVLSQPKSTSATNPETQEE